MSGTGAHGNNPASRAICRRHASRSASRIHLARVPPDCATHASTWAARSRGICTSTDDAVAILPGGRPSLALRGRLTIAPHARLKLRQSQCAIGSRVSESVGAREPPHTTTPRPPPARRLLFPGHTASTAPPPQRGDDEREEKERDEAAHDHVAEVVDEHHVFLLSNAWSNNTQQSGQVGMSSEPVPDKNCSTSSLLRHS